MDAGVTLAVSPAPSTKPSLSRESTCSVDRSQDVDGEDEDILDIVRFDAERHEEMPSALYTLLSCSNTDPFDILPVKPNQQIWKLLTSWLNAGAQVDAAQDGYRMQVSVIRKSWFWPVVNRNKATFNAAGKS